MNDTQPPGRPAARPPRVPPVVFTDADRQRIGAALEALLARIRDAIDRMTLALRTAAQAMQDLFARLGDTDWALVALKARRTARPRPAWASPYGPPPSRHRHRS